MKSLAIFAYNEAGIIADTLASLDEAGLGKEDQVFVLINGCTDNTFDIVQEVSQKDKRIHPVKIDFGDKANAWDVYVDKLGPDNASIHIFLDGDVMPSKGAFHEMKKALEQHPEALAVSTLPRGGRRSKGWAKRIVEKHGMPGNMYGLRKETFTRMREMPIRIPIGYVGDDPLLRFLLLRNLDPQADVKLDYIRPVETAFFEYESFPLNTLWGLKATWKRQLTYARRDLEHAVLVDWLLKQGLKSMPRCADDLWPEFPRAILMQEKLHPRFALFPLTLLRAFLKPKLTMKAKAWDENA